MLECEAGRLRDGGDRDVQEIANWSGERLGLAYAQCGCHPCYMVCASTYEIRTSSASLSNNCHVPRSKREYGSSEEISSLWWEWFLGLQNLQVCGC